MSELNNPDAIIDPVEILNDLLTKTWQELCCTYDAMGNLPDIKTLFEGVDLKKPFQAAKQVLANMLLEMMENIGRFSPWYTRPARAFGLTSMVDPANDKRRWMLASEAVFKWEALLDQLAKAIEQNYSLIQAMVYVEGLMEDPENEEWYLAHCMCQPPRSIRITLSVLKKAEILCEACKQPFV